MSERPVHKVALEFRKIDLYVSGIEIQEDDGSVTYISIEQSVDSLGGSKLLPTVVHQLNTARQVDVYSIDNNGNVLAHTNSSYVDGNEVETRDTSFERLAPYKDDIIGMTELHLLARARLSAAFNMYEQSQSDDSITPPDDAPQA